MGRGRGAGGGSEGGAPSMHGAEVVAMCSASTAMMSAAWMRAALWESDVGSKTAAEILSTADVMRPCLQTCEATLQLKSGRCSHGVKCMHVQERAGTGEVLDGIAGRVSCGSTSVAS